MKTLVVKLGGEVVGSPEMDPIARGLRELCAAGHRVALVHGGGPQATALQKRLGLETRMVAGKRFTDPGTLEVMKYVIAGQVNVDLCAALLRNGVPHLATLKSGLSEWMDRGHYSSLGDFRGSLSQRQIADPGAFERAQYVHLILSQNT